MASEGTAQGLVDAVQTFEVGEGLRQQRPQMATSPNSDITVVRIPPGGDTRIPAQDSDQILVVLQGACTVQGTDGAYDLGSDHGVLVPSGVSCGLANAAADETILLSMRTKKSEKPVANVASDVKVRIPVQHLDAKGIGHRIYAYVMDHRTLGMSPFIMEEWNQASLLRMNCDFERVGDDMVARLPERIVQWYRLGDLSDGDYTIRPDRTRTRVRVDLSPYVGRQLKG